MKITISDEIIKQNGLTTEELLILFLVKNGTNIPELIQKMEEEGKLFKTPSKSNKYYLPDSIYKKMMKCILDGDKDIMSKSDIEILATEMRELFPQGLKSGTNTYWRGNRMDVVQKLQKFFKIYGNYTKEQVLEATKKYVDKYSHDKTTMRTLKYFILKDNESDLATILENSDGSGDPNQLTIDWENELR